MYLYTFAIHILFPFQKFFHWNIQQHGQYLVLLPLFSDLILGMNLSWFILSVPYVYVENFVELILSPFVMIVGNRDPLEVF